MDEDCDCPHIVEAAEKMSSVDVDAMRAELNNRKCNVCVRKDHLLMCVECKQILCDRNTGEHSIGHFQYHQNHCIFLNIESATILCYQCDSEVEPKSHDDELNRLRQFILYNRRPSTVSNENTIRENSCEPVETKKSSGKRRQRINKKSGISKRPKKRDVKTTIQSQSAIDNEESKNDTQSEELKAVKPKKSPKKPFFKRGPRTYHKVGLTNSGNNCFMNAVWQALRHLKPFTYCLKLLNTSDLYSSNNNSYGDKQNCVITEELSKLLIRLIDFENTAGQRKRYSVSPEVLHSIVCKMKPRYKGFHQHDAHEFLMFTLDTLHSELKDENKKLLLEEGMGQVDINNTLVTIMFRGYLLSEVNCLTCNTIYRTRDPFSDISLHVPDYRNEDTLSLESQPVYHLSDCLDRYIEIEKLHKTNFYFCSKCQSPEPSTKRFLFNCLPNLLCLHINRFRWDANYRTKIHTHVQFPLRSLDMSTYLDDDMKKTLTLESSFMFDLLTVVVHHGEGGGSGHYISYGLDDKEGQWYEFNDEKVHKVDEAYVQNTQAYMLIYIKRELRLSLGF